MSLAGDEGLEEEEQGSDTIAGLHQQNELDILAEGPRQAAVGSDEPGALQVRCPCLSSRQHDQHVGSLHSNIPACFPVRIIENHIVMLSGVEPVRLHATCQVAALNSEVDVGPGAALTEADHDPPGAETFNDDIHHWL